MTSQLFQNAQDAGLFYLPPERRAQVEALGPVLAATLESCADGPSALAELGRALAFPDWYGANLDALYDCLTDPDWQPAPGKILSIIGLNAPRQGDPNFFGALLEVLSSAVDMRRDTGQPLWILIDTPAPGIPELPSR